MKKILLLLLAILIAFTFWYRHALTAAGDNASREVVKIPKGSSVQDISSILKEADLIRSPFAFSLYARMSGQARSLQAGSFVVRQAMTTQDIVGVLAGGKAEEEVITIPEGYTVADIDALLAEKGITEPGAILQCAQTCDFSSFAFLPTVSGLAKRGGKIEGYLYPDTYYIALDGFEPKFFLERLLTTFRKRVIEDLSKDIGQSKRPLHEIVTMASLIEEETRTSEERTVVSGILWKRLDDKVGLGVDATVRYILEKPTGALTTADLNVDSAYNLRKFRGLPPGPIANAGLQSIRAALAPSDSPYYYYLHGTDGIIRYARTNEEHNLNKYKYLQ